MQEQFLYNENHLTLPLAHKCYYILLSLFYFAVDFALKHLDMEDGQHVTLQLWDIAGKSY